MKRRRSAPAPEPVCPSEDRTEWHSNSCFGFGGDNTGYLHDAERIFDALPCEPQDTRAFFESTALMLSSAEVPTAMSNSLSIQNLFEFADPELTFAFHVMFTCPFLSWEDVSRNLRITAMLEVGHTQPAVSLRASTSYTKLPHGIGMRITISPAWWSCAASFTIVGLYHAGQLVVTPLLPATIRVMHVNHAPSKAGRLWSSVDAGDASSIVSAIQDGCSTEESNDKVCNMILFTNN